MGPGSRKGARSVLKATGNQDLRTYIDIRQAKVAHWVSLWTIFEVCAQERGYKVRGWRRAPWWRQTAEDAQLRATLKYISEDSRERRQQESVRSGGRGYQRDHKMAE